MSEADAGTEVELRRSILLLPDVEFNTLGAVWLILTVEPELGNIRGFRRIVALVTNFGSVLLLEPLL